MTPYRCPNDGEPLAQSHVWGCYDCPKGCIVSLARLAFHLAGEPFL
jgi:hypothetical protein